MSEPRKLWRKRSGAILCWAGDEPLTLAYNAVRIVVPAIDVVARVAQGAIYTHPAAQLNGRPLPGTAFIEDVIKMNAEGGYVTLLDVDAVCHYLTSGRDDLFAQGFNVVEEASQVREAHEIGRPLYEAAQDQRAREVLSREMSRQKAYKDRGEVPPPPLGQKTVAWAMSHLKRRAPATPTHKIEDIQAVLEGRAVEQAPPPAGLALRSDGEDPQAVFAEAERLHVSMKYNDLAAMLRGDPEAMERVKVAIAAKRAEKEQAAVGA